MREAILRPGAEAYHALMSDVERADVERRLHVLERDPSPDGRTTLAVPEIPGLFIFDDGTWQIVYSVPDEATLVVRSIAHALDLPT